MRWRRDWHCHSLLGASAADAGVHVDASSTVWVHPQGWQSNDINRFNERLLSIAAGRGFRVESIGEVAGDQLLLLQRDALPQKYDTHRPRLLIASGFHGDEVAGPWGCLSFLESVDDVALDSVSLAVLPLVNTTGFRNGSRLNAWGENPNRGFSGTECSPSREGRLLLAQQELLLSLGANGVLACHEDVSLSHGYVYTLERTTVPSPFSRGLLGVNARYFPILPDGDVDGCPVRDGIVFNHVDTSFEHWLMCLGVHRAACVETPGLHPLERRMAAQAAMMQFFLAHQL